MGLVCCWVFVVWVGCLSPFLLLKKGRGHVGAGLWAGSVGVVGLTRRSSVRRPPAPFFPCPHRVLACGGVAPGVRGGREPGRGFEVGCEGFRMLGGERPPSVDDDGGGLTSFALSPPVTSSP